VGEVRKAGRIHVSLTFCFWFSLAPARFCNAFSYYGLVLLTTELFQAGDVCGSEYPTSFHPSATCPARTGTVTHLPHQVPPSPTWPSSNSMVSKIMSDGADMFRVTPNVRISVLKSALLKVD
jgi:hypothetical protein